MTQHDQLNIPILNQIPMTRVRIRIARILYWVIHRFLQNDTHLIHRNGVSYEVDLAEGIDLSLYLFGNFQDHVTRQKYFSISESAVIFDVGANIGSMAFKFAQLASNGRVYAFEPTDYAFNKLLKNISLNPALSGRIIPIQLFLSDQTELNHQIKAYSSWRVDGRAVESHPYHGGTIKSAASVPVARLDDFCLENKIQKVDLIKIDTDGHELPVLTGATSTIEKFRPYVIFEIGLYVLQERGEIFEQYFSYFTSFEYDLINSKNGEKITLENFHKNIPLRSTTDIIAIPQKSVG